MDLQADPWFEDARILAFPRDMNPFRLTDEHWRAISSRVRRAA
jgi:hypothetical protein